MRIRPGDLAISIHTKQPENNGLIVQVVRPFVKTDEWPMAEKSWWCTCAQLMTWGVGKRIVQAHAGPVPEACLFPIRGTGSDGPVSRAKRPTRKVLSSSPSASHGATQSTPASKPVPEAVPALEEDAAECLPA